MGKNIRKQGFTMVELLAVLVILGIIMMIAVPAISKLVSSTDEDYYTSLEGTVRSYGQEYFSDRRTLLPKQQGNIKEIAIQTLVNQKYGDEPVDPKGNTCNGRVVVQRKATGKYEYTTCLECPDYKSGNTVCRYDESTNDKLVITGVENKIVKQGSSFSVPKAQAVINGEKIADVNPSPDKIDTNQLTTYDVYYTYQTAAKIVKYTVTDQTAPSKPNVVLTLANGTAYNQGWTNQVIFQNISATDWTKTDVMGSGIKAFKISGDGKRTWDTITARDGKISLTQTDPVNKTYYVKAIDYAGNESAIVSYTLKLDRTMPSFSSLKIQSTNRSYNVTTTKLTLSASDSQSLKMCISNTGYEKGCSWENFSTQKNWTVPGGLDGITRTVYVTLRDEAGNKVNKAVNYTTYKECSLINVTRPANYGACSKKCGGGLQYRTVTEKDKNTSKVCRTYSENRSCEQQNCCSATEEYQWDSWSACDKTCGGGHSYQKIHKRSTYDRSVYCGYRTASRDCNQQSCENPNDYPWSKEVACNASKFQQVINNNTKFKNYIEYSAFRNAMYDCASVTEPIIRKSSMAIAALKASSRYQIVRTQGRRETSCSMTCPSNCDRDCSNPKPCYDWDWYPNAINPIYGGKALVIGAGAQGGFCTGTGCGDKCDWSSCEYWGKTKVFDQHGDILIGEYGRNNYTTDTWFYKDPDWASVWNNGTIKFMNNFGATAVASYYSYNPDNCSSDERTRWSTTPIVVGFFKI